MKRSLEQQNIGLEDYFNVENHGKNTIINLPRVKLTTTHLRQYWGRFILLALPQHTIPRNFLIAGSQCEFYRAEFSLNVSPFLELQQTCGLTLCEVRWGVIWGFPLMGIPDCRVVYKGRSIYKWMIWGYTHFKKPPFQTILCEVPTGWV